MFDVLRNRPLVVPWSERESHEREVPDCSQDVVARLSNRFVKLFPFGCHLPSSALPVSRRLFREDNIRGHASTDPAYVAELPLKLSWSQSSALPPVTSH
jgi:hypothetical protein